MTILGNSLTPKLRDSADPAEFTLAWAVAGELDGASKVKPTLADSVGA